MNQLIKTEIVVYRSVAFIIKLMSTKKIDSFTAENIFKFPFGMSQFVYFNDMLIPVTYEQLWIFSVAKNS